MVRLNVSSDNLRNCEETTMFVKECEKILKCKKKGIFSLTYKQGYLFKKSKESDKFKEMYRKNGVTKARKSVIKVSKTQIVNEFKQF